MWRKGWALACQAPPASPATPPTSTTWALGRAPHPALSLHMRMQHSVQPPPQPHPNPCRPPLLAHGALPILAPPPAPHPIPCCSHQPAPPPPLLLPPPCASSLAAPTAAPHSLPTPPLHPAACPPHPCTPLLAQHDCSHAVPGQRAPTFAGAEPSRNASMTRDPLGSLEHRARSHSPRAATLSVKSRHAFCGGGGRGCACTRVRACMCTCKWCKCASARVRACVCGAYMWVRAEGGGCGWGQSLHRTVQRLAVVVRAEAMRG